MMKQLFFTVFCCGLLGMAYSQDSTSIYFTQRYKKGVYKTFREFQANNPSEKGDFVIKDKSTAAQIYLLSARNELHIVDSAGQEKKIKKFWGYSDGQSVYIKDNGLNKLEEIGYYCLYRVHAITSATPNRNTEGIVFNNTPPAAVSKKVLNIVTGEVFDLTLYNLRKYILPADTALLSEFNRDRQNLSRMTYYISKFNQRNQPDL